MKHFVKVILLGVVGMGLLNILSCEEIRDVRPEETAILTSNTWLVTKIEGNSTSRNTFSECQPYNSGTVSYDFHAPLGGDRLRGNWMYNSNDVLETDSSKLKAMILCFGLDYELTIHTSFANQGQVFYCDDSSSVSTEWAWINNSRPILRAENFKSLVGEVRSHPLIGEALLSFLDPSLDIHDPDVINTYKLHDLEVITLTNQEMVLSWRILIEEASAQCELDTYERNIRIELESISCPVGGC